MAQIYSQVWISGDPHCMESTCNKLLSDKDTTVFIVGKKKTMGFCCIQCMFKFCTKYMEQDKINKQMNKRNLLRELGYKQPTKE